MIKKTIFLSCMLCNITYSSDKDYAQIQQEEAEEYQRAFFVCNTVYVYEIIEHWVQPILPKESAQLSTKIARAIFDHPIPDGFIFNRYDANLQSITPSTMEKRPTAESLRKLKSLHPEIIVMANVAILQLKEIYGDPPYPNADAKIRICHRQFFRYINDPFPKID